MSYQLLLTTAGSQKIATASNVGNMSIHITDFVVGQGLNVDFSTRLDKQTLVSKRYQGKVESVYSVAGRPNQYEIVCVIPPDIGGFTIREMGLIDSDGVLIWVGSLPEVQKPTADSLSAVDYRLKAVVQIDNPTVSIIVDINAMTATQSWVNANFISKSQFISFLEILFPMGYKYWSHFNQNPKALFDVLFGYETFWRRLEGVELVAVQDNDLFINQPMQYLGQKGLTDTAITTRPHAYPLYTSYLFERYDPAMVVNTVWRVTADKNPTPEGEAVRLTITANNIPDGQILNWTIIEGDSITSDNIANGTAILKNGMALIDYQTTAEDNLEDPNKSIRLTVSAPANLELVVPITDKGHHETVLRINQSTYDGIVLDEYFRQQTGHYATATDKQVRFVVDSGVDIIAPNTSRAAMESGNNWGDDVRIIVENHGRIMGRGGDGGIGGYCYINYGLGSSWSSVINDNVKRSIVPPTNGKDGGTALSSSKHVIVDNYHLISGGGGGGGGEITYCAVQNTYLYYGASGGGGAPFGKVTYNPSSSDFYFQQTSLTSKNIDKSSLVVPTGYFDSSILSVGTRVSGSFLTNVSMRVENASHGSDLVQIIQNPDYGVKPNLFDDTFPSYFFTSFNISKPLQNDYYNILTAMEDSNYAYMKQKQPSAATLLNAGSGGWSFGYTSPNANFNKATQATLESKGLDKNHGGNGGDIGENGQASVTSFYYTPFTSSGLTFTDTPYYKSNSAQGGLAGYIYQGNVTINNINGGTIKGRTP